MNALAYFRQRFFFIGSIFVCFNHFGIEFDEGAVNGEDVERDVTNATLVLQPQSYNKTFAFHHILSLFVSCYDTLLAWMWFYNKGCTLDQMS